MSLFPAQPFSLLSPASIAMEGPEYDVCEGMDVQRGSLPGSYTYLLACLLKLSSQNKLVQNQENLPSSRV